MPEVGVVIGTKYNNFEESFRNLQEQVLQYVVKNYKEGLDLAPLLRKLKGVDLSSKYPTAPTITGNKGTTEISKKIYELELGKHLDRAYILEDHTKLYSLF